MSWFSDAFDWVGNQFSSTPQPQQGGGVTLPQTKAGAGGAPMTVMNPMPAASAPGASPSWLSQGWDFLSGGKSGLGGIANLTKNIAPIVVPTALATSVVNCVAIALTGN